PENRGTDWITLAPDQETIYYTSEGNSVLRFDTATGTQLAPFTTSLPGGGAFALRFLADSDLIVADAGSIERLDPNGAIVQSYTAPNADEFFAVNRDPDGTSFWSADINTNVIYKFDLATGAILTQFNSGSSSQTTGLVIVGEPLGTQLPPLLATG